MVDKKSQLLKEEAGFLGFKQTLTMQR